MKKIKRMNIIGFKKFKNFKTKFNDDINIVIGDNESGKSTLLEAIDVVLLQKYRNYDKYIIKELLNRELISKFELEPCIENLPRITINIEFELDDLPVNGLFYGENHDFEKNKKLFGIRFICEIPQEFIPDLMPIISIGKIPYEYYQMSWNTFQGDQYNLLKKPLNFLLIDNESADSANSYNYYNKNLFISSHDPALQQGIKSEFRTKINDLFDDLNLNKISDNQKFGVNERKLIFENILTILDDSIPIENKGKGKENIIKTKIALDKNVGKMDVIAIEEPENHLSFNNLKIMIEDIKKQINNHQLIITTHESMIASSLNLKNVMWIKEENTETLKDLDDDDSLYFLKSPNNNLLQYILSEKVILVEGPTEFLLVPKFFKEFYKESLDSFGINIISCSGVSYKRYIDIANKMNKKVVIITDNDKNETNIIEKNKFNNEHEKIKIFMDESIENWTWESCFYNLNKEKFDELIVTENGANYLFHGQDYGKILGKMLNNKVDTAFIMYNSEYSFTIPDYIKKALEWIKE